MPNDLKSLKGKSAPLIWNPQGISQSWSELRVYFGEDKFGMGLQVVVGIWNHSAPPSRSELEDLYKTRLGKQVFPLAVAALDTAGHLWIFGPNQESPRFGPLSESQGTRILQSALFETSGISARKLLVRAQDSVATTAMPGISNTGLFASYYLRTSAPERPDWETSATLAESLLPLRGEQLIKSLGFTTEWVGSTAILLKNDVQIPRAVAVLLDESESFAQPSPRFVQSPIAWGLSEAQRNELQWLIALRGSQIRLYSAKADKGVGRKGQSETYLEVDLALVDERYQPLLPLIFSANALAPNGSTEEILTSSGLYAVSLGQRLRDRVYQTLVPKLSVAVANEMTRLGLDLDANGLEIAYGATLRILFRLLFQAYGEDRSLLPFGRNPTYDRHALKTIAKELLESPPANENDSSSSLWQDLSNAWQVIDQGDPSWSVPAYNGGLFSSKDEEGKLLAKIAILNKIFVPALRALLVDNGEDGIEGPVDFRSLSVREFGTIYEGLLESSLSVAETDLKLDKNQTWIPAQSGDAVGAIAGEVYFHNASGARKSTGSYFTQSFIVDHLIERSLDPSLDKHFAMVQALLEKGDEPAAARKFFDFRVADLAMGSGHFLVSAIDHIEAKMTAFLAEHPMPQVEEELLSLANAAREALGQNAAEIEIEPSSLLRRQIARRCIYGLDINPIAVELARVAIWIHTFIPGLAMSSLDHGLVCANSLTGIGTINEALKELDAQSGKSGQISLFGALIEDKLSEASQLLIESASAAEATAKDVEYASQIAKEARTRAEQTKLLFDAAVAARLGLLRTVGGADPSVIEKRSMQPEIRELVTTLKPAHMPYLFPEVFLRENGGFDVLVGNPPWEKMHLEEDQWWGMRFPGLHVHSQLQKNKSLAEFQESHPELDREFQKAVLQKELERNVISKGPFPGISSGHIDLFEAFCWRNYQLLRREGYLGLVLPRGAIAGSGTVEWRKEVLTNATFTDVCLLANTKHWVFTDVDTRYNIALTTVSKTTSDVLSFTGPFHSAEEFEKGKDQLTTVKSSDFATWSSTYAFPWLPDAKSVEIFLALRRHPRFDSKESFEFRPVQGDCNTTNNKRLWDFDLTNPIGDVLVYSGRTFNLWDPDFGDPYAFAHSDEVFPFLENKLVNQRGNRRSAFYGLSDEALTPRPWQRARIAFRDVARATDTRTVIACLIPPGAVAVHKAPYLFRKGGSASDEAFLLGMLSSIIFDWYARRYVELSLSFEILNPMPIPRPSLDNALRHRVIEISGRLAAVDERFNEWAKEVGVTVGSVTDPTEKNDLIAELDAVVAHLYQLSEDQLTHIFETFHRGWSYQARLEATVQHFRLWGRKL